MNTFGVVENKKKILKKGNYEANSRNIEKSWDEE